jgi:hypothetical protein
LDRCALRPGLIRGETHHLFTDAEERSDEETASSTLAAVGSNTLLADALCSPIAKVSRAGFSSVSKLLSTISDIRPDLDAQVCKISLLFLHRETA